MTTAPAQKPTAPVLGDWQPLPTAGAPTTTPAAKPADVEPPAPDRRIDRLRAKSNEKRADRDHDLDLKARRSEITRTEKAARKQQKRDDRLARRADHKKQRADKLAQHAEHITKLKLFAVGAGRRLMVIGPIAAPMAVAWSSQTSYAKEAFDWPLVFALGFAAAWELSTTFTGWMYHQARKTGDRGLEYRILTWVFALGAAAMNYAHHCGPHGAPTQAAVAFSAMSITGMVLWEAYARLVHRKALRDQGLVPNPRPRLGLVRWVRYPVHAWTAWSLTIRSADLNTADKAWTAAARDLMDRKDRRSTDRADRKAKRSMDQADQKAVRSGLAVHRVVVPRVRTADHGPSGIPTFHVKMDRLDHPRTAPARSTTTTDRELSDRTTPAAIEAAPMDRMDRTATVDRTRTTSTDRTGSTSAQRTTTSPMDQADRPDRTATTDRTEADLVLTDLEAQAIEVLRSTNRSISKRSISDVVRNELGGSIGSDRSVQIARHFRTLRSAA